MGRSISTPIQVDLNRDGRPDMLFDDGSNYRLVWWENLGGDPATFAPREVHRFNNDHLDAINVGDIDQDSDIDIVYTMGYGEIGWFENVDGSATNWVAHVVGTNSSIYYFRLNSIAVGDLYTNGFPDIVICENTLSGKVFAYENQAGGTGWVQRTLASPVDEPSQAIVVDVDSDNDLDVVVAQKYQDKISWLENDGSSPPSFTLRQMAAGLSRIDALTPAYINDDGLIDFAGVLPFNGAVLWFRNQGGTPASFVPGVVVTHANPRTLTVANVDADAPVEFIFGATDSSYGGVYWVDNSGGVNPTFSEATINAYATHNRSVYVLAGDFNTDSHTDVVAVTSWQVSSPGSDMDLYTHQGGSNAAWSVTNLFRDADVPSRWIVMDLDKDQDSDLLVGGDPVTAYEQVTPGQYEAHELGHAIRNISVADMNGDGWPDIVGDNAASSASAVQILLHDPINPFSFVRSTNALTYFSEALTLADVDRDGLTDIVVLREDTLTDMYWLKNLGGSDPQYSQQLVFNTINDPASVISTDINRDGWPDFLVNAGHATGYKNYTLLVNGGSVPPFFSSYPIATEKGLAGASFVDADSDGDLDIVYAANQGTLNPAEIRFRETTGLTPYTSTEHVIVSDGNGGNIYAMTVLDVDHDGDRDIVQARGTSGARGYYYASWYENLGTSFLSFAEHVLPSPTGTGDIHQNFYLAYPADVDRDHDMDFILPNKDFREVSLLENRLIHRNAVFAPPHEIRRDGSIYEGLHFADINQDGRRDILAAKNSSILWFESRASNGTSFVEHPVDSLTGFQWFLCAGDLDRDGDPDIAAGSSSGGLRWIENTSGDGSTWNTITIDSTVVIPKDVTIVDVDGDADLDILAYSQFGERVMWYENRIESGSMTFSNRVVISVNEISPFKPQAIAVDDFDLDGDPDVISSIFANGVIFLHENEQPASGTWPTEVVATNFSIPKDLAVGDMNQDGRNDIVCTAADTVYLYLLNPTSRNVRVESRLSFAFTNAGQVVVADFDLDADQDLFVTEQNGSMTRLYEQTSAGVFTVHDQPNDPINVVSAFAGDVDRDGDPDVMLGGFNGFNLQWRSNEGGQFGLPTFDLITNGVSQGMPVACLAIDFLHRGRAGDGAARLETLEILFETTNNTPITTEELDGLVTSIDLYQDDNGNGVFDSAEDDLIATESAPVVSSGVFTFNLNDGADPVHASALATRYFLVLNLADDARYQRPHTIKAIHMLEASSTSEDDEYGLPLLLEYSTNTASALALIMDPDTDRDGMPDSFESAHFGSPVGGNSDKDSDNDGASNYEEFVAGTDPTNALSRLGVNIAAHSNRAVRVSWFSQPSRYYKVHAVSALNVSTNWNQISPELEGTGGELELIHDEPVSFMNFRVTVSLP